MHYYLFIDTYYSVHHVFGLLQTVNKPEFYYSYIKDETDTIPKKTIVIKTTCYSDKYVFDKVTTDLIELGYDRNFKILKPLCKTEVLT